MLHLPVVDTTEVHATNKLHTDDLHAIHGIKLRTGVEVYKVELYS
jgi:hypothetical protein